MHAEVTTLLYVQPLAQHTAVLPAKLALHLTGSGLAPALPAKSRPGQSPTPTSCQVPLAAGGGAAGGGATAAAQVYIWPGFAPPVHAAVATLL